MRISGLFVLVFWAAISGVAAFGHEFWIEADNYQPAADGQINAHLKNGQFFEGRNFSYVTRSFTRFQMYRNGAFADVPGREGNLPAVQLSGAGNGLLGFTFSSIPMIVSYEEFEKFEAFAEHKDFESIAERHRARGLPEQDFKELYTRYAKMLVGAGSAAGTDIETGLETEIVLLANPYTDDVSNGLRALVKYQGQPRRNVQVEIFDRSPDGEVNISTTRTDNDGIATISVVPGHTYLLDSVVLREPSAEVAERRNAVWETLWASMTFAVPD